MLKVKTHRAKHEPPRQYSFQILQLQRLIPVLTNDPRIDVAERAEMFDALNKLTEMMGKISRRELPARTPRS